MQKLKHLIEHIFTKKNIKIFLLLFVVVWFFVWISFAADTSEKPSLVKQAGYLLHVLISILSWVWILLAALAWKLMTNDFVYGSFLHLDKALWDLWNIMKNFANFTLWFLLIFTIVKNLFKWSFGASDGDPIKGAKDVIVKTLIAWVLVQMSWFLMAAMLDLSTIATAAVWALPSQFMSSSTSFQTKVTEMKSKTNKKLVVDFSNNWDTVDSSILLNDATTEDLNKFLDTIMPNPSSLGWSFMFLWASVFNLFELSDTSTNESWTYDIWDLVLSLWINWFVLLSFSLMLALIFVFNLFRVITLWVIIPLMPFVILVTVFLKWKIKVEWFIWQALNYENILKLIFKPVYMTLVLSIILIVMVLIRSLAKANGGLIDWQQQNNMTIESKQQWSGYESSLDVADIANIKLNLRESLVDLLVYFFWLALMFTMMKSCMSWKLTWIDFIDKRVGNLSKSLWWDEKWMKIWWILWSAWVIPIWGGEKVWLNKISDFKNRLMDSSSWTNAVWIDTSKQDASIANLLGWWVTFAALTTSGMSKDAWTRKAAKIWIDMGYKSYDDMNYRDENYKAKLEEWNNYCDDYNRSWDKITDKDMRNAWKAELESRSGNSTKKS